tara:strand:- start:115 stop:321 length:207 start_codon:yes stop_codon:yes gene_type:complete
MKIKTAKYKGTLKWDSEKGELVYDNSVNDNIIAIIDDQEMFVPIDDENIHYKAILKWVAEGNTIDPAG